MASKYDLLTRLPAGALKEVAGWLDARNRLTTERKGWAKADYVEVLSRKLTATEAQTLHDCVERDAPHFSEELAVGLFGLPPKTRMIELMGREALRAAMVKLEATRNVEVSWRSFTAHELEAYLLRNLSAQELATEVGILKPPRRQQREHTSDPSTRESQRVTPVVAPRREADAHASVLVTPPDPAARGPVARDGLLWTIDEVLSYVGQGELLRELVALERLGQTEATFQAEIYGLIKRRLAEPFGMECNFTVRGNKRPDIVIIHQRGQIAIEIKPDGALQPLLADLSKLRRYVRQRSAGILFGFMIYRSTRADHPDVSRALRDEVRVRVLRVPARY